MKKTFMVTVPTRYAWGICPYAREIEEAFQFLNKASPLLLRLPTYELEEVIDAEVLSDDTRGILREILQEIRLISYSVPDKFPYKWELKSIDGVDFDILVIEVSFAGYRGG